MDILKSKVVKDATNLYFKNQRFEIINRGTSIIIRLKKEAGFKILRLILIAPNGYTSNKPNELAPHPEVRKATIKIKGAIKSENANLSYLKNIIKYIYYTKREINATLHKTYALADINNIYYKEDIRSSKDNFFVVKENGNGFYHNLINLSSNWVLLILKKELKPIKKINITKYLNNSDSKGVFQEIYSEIQDNGDNLFAINKKLVSKFVLIDYNLTILFLINLLNIYETGKHEPCTVFGLILKIAKQNPKQTLNYLNIALSNKEAPEYYLTELIKKITKFN